MESKGGALSGIAFPARGSDDGWIGEGEPCWIGARLNAKLHVAVSKLPAVIRDETHIDDDAVCLG